MRLSCLRREVSFANIRPHLVYLYTKRWPGYAYFGIAYITHEDRYASSYRSDWRRPV